MTRRIKIGDLVQRQDRARWYGKVFDLEMQPYKPVKAVVVMFCDQNGRPHRKVKRTKIDIDYLDVVTELPDRFDGRIPIRLPDGPTGTPPRKFTDEFQVDDEVWVKRYEHGWDIGMGVITQLSDFRCFVRLENGGEIHIRKPRDISLQNRPRRNKRSKK